MDGQADSHLEEPQRQIDKPQLIEQHSTVQDSKAQDTELSLQVESNNLDEEASCENRKEIEPLQQASQSEAAAPLENDVRVE